MMFPPSMTGEPIAVPPAQEQVFLFIKHDDLPGKIREGWIPTHALTGTHHGFWSVLCRLDDRPEEWRDVPGYDGIYQASSYGSVRSLDRIIKKAGAVRGYPRSIAGKILKVQKSNSGYYFVSLPFISSDGCRLRPRYVAHLVALAFIGSRPSPDHEVAHWDGFRGNNRSDNLRYATRIENAEDRIRHGMQTRGELASKKLTEQNVREIRRRAVLETAKSIAADFKVSETTVGQIISRKRWGHLDLHEGEAGTPLADLERAERIRRQSSSWTDILRARGLCKVKGISA